MRRVDRGQDRGRWWYRWQWQVAAFVAASGPDPVTLAETGELGLILRLWRDGDAGTDGREAGWGSEPYHTPVMLSAADA